MFILIQKLKQAKSALKQWATALGHERNASLSDVNKDLESIQEGLQNDLTDEQLHMRERECKEHMYMY